MRTSSSRARAAIGMGVLTTAIGAAGVATAAAQQAAPASGSTQTAPSTQPAPTATAAAKRGSSLRITSRRLNIRAGRTARVGGRLLPAAAGRTVTLERRGARGWKTIDKARTTSGGAFRLTFKARRVDT